MRAGYCAEKNGGALVSFVTKNHALKPSPNACYIIMTEGRFGFLLVRLTCLYGAKLYRV